ncbi:hypothetical protein ACGF0J_15410 [Nonomuraea sp. NPDC047897]|uniref:hypothetical protein n=1 Tax=Nonomuraea sp. NPDC047897 TaxID=3364346 RepID=UPI00371F49F7
MTRRLVLVSLAVGALTVPAPASSAATGHALTSSVPSGLAPAAGLASAAAATTRSAASAPVAAPVAAPAPAPAPTPVAPGLAIREILVRPAEPVVGPENSVRMVIDVIAKGVHGKDGVTVKVEPGAPPQLADDSGAAPPTPQPAVSTLPAEVRPGDPALARPEPAASMPVQHVPSQPRAVTLPATGPAPFPHAAVKAAAGRPGKAARPGRAGGAGKATTAGGPFGRPTGRKPSNMDWPLSRWPARPGQAGHAGRGPVRQGEMGPAAWPDRAARLAAEPVRGRTEGWETWRFLPDKALNRFYPSGTWTITATARDAAGASVTRTTTFQLRRETRLTSVRFGEAQGPAQVRLSGVLNRVGSRGHAGYAAFAEQPVEILWRAGASGSWQKVAAASTGERGAFTRTVRGRPGGGQWRVRFAGTEDYAPVLSRVFDVGGHRD